MGSKTHQKPVLHDCLCNSWVPKGMYAVWIAYHHLVLNFIPSALSCFWNDVCCLSLEDCHYVS